MSQVNFKAWGRSGQQWVRAAELSDLTDASRRIHIFYLRSSLGHWTAILRTESVQLLGWELVNNRSQGIKGVFILHYEIIHFFTGFWVVFAGIQKRVVRPLI